MGTLVKIRGIYTTALTQIFKENNFSIVQPSPEIIGRFPGYNKFLPSGNPQVEIVDREDKQGLVLSGEEAKVKLLIRVLRERLYDLIVLNSKKEKNCVEIIFPYQAKVQLDEVRNMVLPTLKHHHNLRIVASQYVDLFEKNQLNKFPQNRVELGETLMRELIYKSLEAGKEIRIHHTKLNGETVQLSEGEILEFNLDQRRLILKRSKYKGRGEYDGLKILKEEGDYAITEAIQGGWFLKHTYYSKEGRLIGEYYNINTPLEFYPDFLNYLDLEVDVVRWPDGRIEVIDEEILMEAVEGGSVSKELAAKALEIAYNITESK